jgi:hypothetical protein
MVTANQEANMTTHERIRQIFLQPQDAYTIEETAALLGYSHEEILAAISRGDIAIEGVGELPRIEWEELALAAVERWPQEVIEDALGTDSASVLPELVRLTDLRVRVPRYGVVVLGRLAQRQGTTINDLVARQLLDLTVAESDVLGQSVAGLDAAVRWPLR